MKAATMKKIATWVNANSVGFTASIRDWTRTVEFRSAGNRYVNSRRSYDSKRLEFNVPGELRPIYTFLAGETYRKNSDIENFLRGKLTEELWHKFLTDTNRPLDYKPGW